MANLRPIENRLKIINGCLLLYPIPRTKTGHLKYILNRNRFIITDLRANNFWLICAELKSKFEFLRDYTLYPKSIRWWNIFFKLPGKSFFFFQPSSKLYILIQISSAVIIMMVSRLFFRRRNFWFEPRLDTLEINNHLKLS